MDTREGRIYYTIVIATLVLVFVISFFIGIMIRLKRKLLLSYKDKIFTESFIAENERARIAADLHDELGSSLAAIKLHLECLEPYNSKERESIKTTGGYIDSAMIKIREISNNLTPQVLQHSSFFTAAREFCLTTGRKGRIQMRFNCTNTLRIIAKEKEIQLYRILLEIITNAVRHGKPLHIDVSLAIKNNLLVMNVSDDGRGFDKTLVKRATGSGLHNIVNRVNMLQGTIYLDTGVGLGTDYTIEIPV